MKGKVKMNWTLIIILLLNILGIGFIKLHDQNKYIKTKTGIEKHGEYAIGIITLIPPEGKLIKQGGAERILYKYKKQIFEGDAVGPFKMTKKNDKYIVIFDTTNLKHCMVLYDYPVKDSLQFVRDMEFLRKNPPKPYDTLIWKCFRNKEKLW